MFLQRIYDEDLASASYFIGCQAKGEALVLDPRRDISVYLDMAAKQGMTITHVTETHIHADYLSGTRQLANATGAEIHLSAEGGPDWLYDFEGTPMHDGDSFELGNITVKAAHTPGHTPEHLMFLVTDGAFANEPGFAFTGDFVFVGELGRPDLLDEAAGGDNTRVQGAKDLFASLRTKFVSLPDYVQVLPAHGAGSACGKSLGAVPTSTVGYEKANAWWAPYVENNDEQGFMDELLDGQPDAHAYFGRMKRQNKSGPAVLGERPEPHELSADEVNNQLKNNEAIFVDTRSHQQVHQGTVPGSLHIPGPDQTATFGAWGYDPERESQPLVLLATDQSQAEAMRDSLARVGIDAVKGFVTSLDGFQLSTPEILEPEQLEQATKDKRDKKYDLLLDVRNRSEYAAGHIPGASQLSAGPPSGIPIHCLLTAPS
ncbi:putative polyketide biosynthesis zinc-dependent hydrolase BaeB [Corynebacterium heidelbergense]|nr:putative polyketide biosynthesis zinc-dependent hydrolase BaeB [Corynebacterium heidelbergense]